MKTALKYGGGLIALYLVVAHGTQFGKAARGGAAGASNIIKTLQGR
ncbi:MAG: hypothetical protein QM714_12530 [Nocardioides sp.]